MLNRFKGKRVRRNPISVRERLSQGRSKAILRPGKSEKEIIQKHQDVLQNIEFILVTGYRKDSSIDDLIITEVLKTAIEDEIPTDARAKSLLQELEGIRQFRSDVPDELWQECLRTILQSVHRHSSQKPGSRKYLNFVGKFIL